MGLLSRGNQKLNAGLFAPVSKVILKIPRLQTLLDEISK